MNNVIKFRKRKKQIVKLVHRKFLIIPMLGIYTLILLYLLYGASLGK